MLILMLNLDKEVYPSGSSIPGKLILKNSGTAPVLVNGRLALNAPFAPKLFREVRLEITDPDGESVYFDASVNIGEPKTKHFQDLAPGDTVEHTYDLDLFYSFDKSGTYTIQAIYENQSDPGNGREAWKGKLGSSVVLLTIEA